VDYTHIWWDIRPHPRLGTIELRVCDAVTRIEDAVAITAFVQALVKTYCELVDAGHEVPSFHRILVVENKWRAARYGLDGKMIDFGKQTEVPARDLVAEYLEFVDDVVDELDSREELNYLHKILEHGTGADRQLRVFAETGDLKKVVDYIIEETEAGLEEEPATVRKVG